MDIEIERIINCIKTNEKTLNKYKKTNRQRMIDYLEGVLVGLQLSYDIITGEEYEDL